MEQKEKIKPCPFCGSDQVGGDYNMSRYGKRYYFVRCLVCGARTRGESVLKESLDPEDEWNNAAYLTSVACWNQRAVNDRA